MKTINWLFDQMPNGLADKSAVIVEGNNFSYNRLHQRASQIASHLLSQVPDEKIIAIYSQVNFDYIAGIWGILLSGKAYLPLDIRTPFARLSEILDHTGCGVILSQDKVDLNYNFLYLNQIASIESGVDHSLNNPENIAAIIYTSGSTGKPKAVALSHRAIVNHYLWCEQMYKDSYPYNVLLLSSPSFSLSITPLYYALLSGSTLVIPPTEWLANFNLLASVVKNQQISLIKTVPSLFRRLLKLAQKEISSFESLKLIILSGEAIDANTVIEWKKLYPDCRIIVTYGLTEAFSFTFYEIPNNYNGQLIPIGKSTSGNKVFVLDKNLQPCKAGDTGNIYVSGRGLASGYLKNSQLFPLNLIGQEKMFATGDSGYFNSSGELIFCGRNDLVVKIRGYRVDLEEVERHISCFRGVERAVVVEKDGRLICYLKVVADIKSSELRNHLTKNIPDYMMPSEFFICDEIPLLASGKIDRKQSLHLQGNRLNDCSEQIEKLTEIQQDVLKIWQELLGIKSDIGLDDEFFNIGGDSLASIDMLCRIEEGFNIKISENINLLSIRALSEFIKKQLAQGSTVSLEKMDFTVTEVVPIVDVLRLLKPRKMFDVKLLYGSKREFTISQRHRIHKSKNSRFDVTYVRIRFKELNQEDLLKTLSILINRHDVFRTWLLPRRKKQKIVLKLEGKGFLPYLDCSDWSESKINKMFLDLALMPLKVNRWPAFRWILLKKKDCHEFIWQISHTVFDLVSGDILASELINLYELVCQGRPISFPVRNISVEEFNAEQGKMTYPKKVMLAIQNEAKDYFQQVAMCKKVLSSFSSIQDKKTQEYFFENHFSADIAVYKIIALYAMSLSKWLGAKKIPIRIGTSGRMYRSLVKDYRRLPMQANDHYLFVMDVLDNDTIESVSRRIEEKIIFFRKNEVNFDNIILMSGKKISSIDSGHIFSCGPLGDISVKTNKDGTVFSVPRPLWGVNSFRPMSMGTKLGLYSFRKNGFTHLHLHAKSISHESFTKLIGILKSF